MNPAPNSLAEQDEQTRSPCPAGSANAPGLLQWEIGIAVETGLKNETALRSFFCKTRESVRVVLFSVQGPMAVGAAASPGGAWGPGSARVAHPMLGVLLAGGSPCGGGRGAPGLTPAVWLCGEELSSPFRASRDPEGRPEGCRDDRSPCERLGGAWACPCAANDSRSLCRLFRVF